MWCERHHSDRHLLSSTRMFCEIMGCVVAYKCIIQSNTVAKSIVSRRCEDPIFILVKKKHNYALFVVCVAGVRLWFRDLCLGKVDGTLMRIGIL